MLEATRRRNPKGPCRHPARRAERRTAPAPGATLGGLARGVRASGLPGRARSVLDAVPEAVLVSDAEAGSGSRNPAVDRMFQGRAIVDHRDLMSRFDRCPPARPDRGHAPRPADADAQPLVRSCGRCRSAGRGRARARPDSRARDVTADRAAAEGYATSRSSHELRTPITTIYAGSRLLSCRGRQVRRPRKEIATDINVEAARLYDLVEDLLALTRVERELPR